MKRIEVLAGMAALGLGAAAALAPADEIKGTFHFGDVRFTVADGLAYRADGQERGQPITVLVFTDFKIDRSSVMDAIETTSAVMGQIARQQSGNVVFVTLATAGQCGVSAFLGGSHSAGLGEGFNATTKVATPSRISGECATLKPGKVFEDAYEFRLEYDLPITTIPEPTALAAGGGEPGAAYLALVKAIQAADFATARRHLPAEQTPPKAAEVKDYFHGLALNYPKTATVVGGLVKGGQARIEIQGVDNDGKKIKGGVNLRKVAGDWRVVDHGYFFAE